MEDEACKQRIAKTYFQNFFVASSIRNEKRALMGTNRFIDENMKFGINEGILKGEIKVVVMSMTPVKAFREDGFPALSFQKFWHIVGEKVSEFCLDVLNRKKKVGSINNTNIVLLPKTSNPIEMIQFRPISLCNVLYKIMAKVMVNKFREFLDRCVDKAQATFVLGRQITDNAFIVYNVL